MSNGPAPPVINIVIRIEDGEVLNQYPDGGPADDGLPKDAKVLVAWAESSPGCVYVNHGGVWRRVCFP